jgi:hypothetical protein
VKVRKVRNHVEWTLPEGGGLPFSRLGDLRDKFMAAAFAVEPELEKSLRDFYEEKLRGRSEWLTPDRLSPGCVGDAETVDLTTDKEGSAFQFAREQIGPWSARWYLADRWCGEWVIHHKLAHWWTAERGIASASATGWAGKGPGLGSRPFILKLKGWTMDGWPVPLGSRAEFEDKARQVFESALAHYCDSIEQDLKAAGYVQFPGKREIDHFHWLARYQVKGETGGVIFKSLAQRRGNRWTVDKAIHGLAKLIGLTLRPANS